MKYKIVMENFKTPDGREMVFSYRKGTSDFEILSDVFLGDRYKILDLDLKKDDTVLDLGAHLGAATLLLASRRDDLKIFAFEPLRENFELLKKNVLDNGIKSEINLFNQAVWFYDDDTVKLFYGDKSPRGRYYHFLGSLFKVQDFYKRDLFKFVNTASLSKIFEDQHIFSCKFLKMNVEGAEYGILRAAPKEVLGMIDRISGEYHNVEPFEIKMPRECLLNQTKGVFKDETGQPERGNVGPFVFVKDLSEKGVEE